MEKIIERSYLFDFYGDLLTEHQREIYSECVFNDLSLSELSEEEGISRQGIHDLIKRCDKMMLAYEEKLHLIERFNSIHKTVDSLKETVANNPHADKAVDERILKSLEEILGEL